MGEEVGVELREAQPGQSRPRARACCRRWWGRSAAAAALRLGLGGRHGEGEEDRDGRPSSATSLVGRHLPLPHEGAQPAAVLSFPSLWCRWWCRRRLRHF